MLESLNLAGAGPLATAALAFAVIALAEIGDKSQLVCITLASRYRGWPVFVGATLAFVLLNGLAVIFGATVAAWLPMPLIAALVALLFAGFGLHTLLTRGENEAADVAQRSGRSVILTTFLIIFIAEFGDKTQIAIAGLSTTAPPFPVWLGATLGLVLSGGIGILAGRFLLQRIPVKTLKTISGLLFLALAAMALVPLFA